MFQFFRRALLAFLIPVMTFLIGVINPTPPPNNPPEPPNPPNPTGNLSISVSYSRAQVGDTIAVYHQDMCPPMSVDHSPGARGVFTDANNQVFNNLDISPLDYENPGEWQDGMFTIPEGAALGVGSLTVECAETEWINDEMVRTVTQSYDPVAITVVGQTTDITVDKTHKWGTAHFSSVTPCAIPGEVELHLLSKETMYHGGEEGMKYRTHQTANVTTDASGNWSHDWNLYQNDNTDFFERGLVYSIRARCHGPGPDYLYDSYQFTLKSDEYVALGDSYSSGLGSYNYDLAGDPSCYRSTDSYAYYVADRLSLGLPNLRACAGAVTADLEWGQIFENHLTPDTEKVTLTIGGNDLGFVEVLTACAKRPFHAGWGCSTDSSLVNSVNERRAALAGTAGNPVLTPGGREIMSYQSVFAMIASANRAPNASIYIAGYPRLFGSSTNNFTANSDAPGGYICAEIPGSFSYADTQWMNDQVDELNTVIINAVNAARSSGMDVTYVPPVFQGHGHCDEYTPWLNWVSVGGPDDPRLLPESMHPNTDGIELGYGTSFEAQME